MRLEFLIGVLAALCAGVVFGWGWMFAHAEVAIECERQGSFYVGNSVFDCKRRIDR